MPLTDSAIRALKPATKPHGLSDGGGLRLVVHPSGAKTFLQSYRVNGKQKQITIGSYPEMKLSDARARREEIKTVAKSGFDPDPKAKPAPELPENDDDLLGPEPVLVEKPEGDRWRDVCKAHVIKRQRQGQDSTTIKKLTWLLEKTYPSIGERVITTLKRDDFVAVLREVEETGLTEVNRLPSYIRAVLKTAKNNFDLPVDAGALTSDLTEVLLVRHREKHHAAVTEPAAIGKLLRTIRGTTRGKLQTRAALLLQAYCFQRPGETRQARWSEFDFEDAVWRIPGARMKGEKPDSKRDQVVPLARQVIEILRKVQGLTGDREFVFSGSRDLDSGLSGASMNNLLARIGYGSDQHTPHGFRTTASTSLYEAGWPGAWIEKQLHHIDENKVRAAYNAAEYLEGRRDMMQAYADWLDALAAERSTSVRDLREVRKEVA